jgi:hypothetical protein
MSEEVAHKEPTKGYLGTPAIAEASRFCFRLIAGLIVVAIVWIAFSSFVVPAVIKSAYRGESIQAFNSLISGQAVNPADHYLATWKRFSWRVLGMMLAVGLIPLPLVATGPKFQSYFEARYGRVLALHPATINTVVALFAFAFVFYFYFYSPVGYVYFVAEDHWAEYGTFVSSAMAFFFLAWVLVKSHRFRKPGFALLAVGAFFLAMEEINWGQRILELRSPSLFTKYNVVGEIGFHNLGPVHGGYLQMVAGIVVFVWSILLPVLTKQSRRLQGWCNKLGIPIVP